MEGFNFGNRTLCVGKIIFVVVVVVVLFFVPASFHYML